MNPRFLQVHTLCPFAGVLLNRDEHGQAKRLPYGGVWRTRVSSQCLKRHWQQAYAYHSLERLAEASVRSRHLVDEIFQRARSREIRWDGAVAEALAPWLQFAIYGSRPEDAPRERGEKSRFDEERQPLLFGVPEIEWLSGEVARLIKKAKGNPDSAFRLAKQWVNGDGNGNSRKAFLANMKAMRTSTEHPAGLTAALFGRMVTSDPAANMDAPLHVAHAFTVHEEETETDYLTAADDLLDSGSSAATIQNAELTSCLFYGYVVVDISALAANLGEKPPKAPLTGWVLDNLVRLIAEVTPGSKLGSTAPYTRASLMLLEAGDRQPRSLAEAYRTPCAPELAAAAEALAAHLSALDKVYATGEQRRALSIADVPIADAGPGSLADLAAWVRGLPEE